MTESEKQLEASRIIAAPIDRVFAVLEDPRQHVLIDGSGTVKDTESGPITHVGQVFTVNMHRADLGH
jgi:hypothetical protein